MDIFIKLAEDLKSRKVTNFTGYLHVVCKNYCLMKLRRMDFYKNNVYLDELNFKDLNALALEPVQDEMEVKDDDLEIALQQLNENQKTCVCLFYLEEKSYREIASETGFELIMRKYTRQATSTEENRNRGIEFRDMALMV